MGGSGIGIRIGIGGGGIVVFGGGNKGGGEGVHCVCCELSWENGGEWWRVRGIRLWWLLSGYQCCIGWITWWGWGLVSCAVVPRYTEYIGEDWDGG